MRMLACLAAAALTTSIGSAQPNPFKLPKSNLKAKITYELTGDQKGTAEAVYDGDRVLNVSTSSIKMMGKETKSSTWNLITADSMYVVDLEKKEGSAGPNLLPLYAKAYDDLDGAGKQRFHSNTKEMGALMSRAFNIGSLNMQGDKLGDETIAGEVCENRKFGGFEVCSMKKSPALALRTSGDLVCFRFEQKATSVSLGSPSADWSVPAGVKLTPLPMAGDSAARGFVNYLASQQLTDSLAKAKAELEQAKAEAAAKGQPQELTKEQKEAMRQACETLKNFDLGKALNNALKEMERELGNAAVDAAKQSATNKLKGLIKKPKIPID